MRSRTGGSKQTPDEEFFTLNMCISHLQRSCAPVAPPRARVARTAAPRPRVVSAPDDGSCVSPHPDPQD